MRLVSSVLQLGVILWMALGEILNQTIAIAEAGLKKNLVSHGNKIVAATGVNIKVYDGTTGTVLATLVNPEALAVGGQFIKLYHGDTTNIVIAACTNGKMFVYDLDTALLTMKNYVGGLSLKDNTIIDFVNMKFMNYLAVISPTSLWVVDVILGNDFRTVLPGGGATFTAVRHLDYSRYIVAALNSGIIRLIDYTEALPPAQNSVVLTPGGDYVTALAPIWRKSLIAAGTNQGGLLTYDTTFLVTYAENTPRVPVSPLDGRVNDLVWVPSSEYVIAGYQLGGVKIWKVTLTDGFGPTPELAIPSATPITVIAQNMNNKKGYFFGASAATSVITFPAIPSLACSPSCGPGACTDWSEYGCVDCPPASPTLENGFCYKVCPAQQYIYKQNNTCLACHADCMTCTGESIMQCTSCFDPLKKISTAQLCEVGCSPGSYILNVTHCASCFPTCATCSASTKSDCLTCVSPRVLDTNGECNLNCMIGGYKDTPLTCAYCHPLCRSCTGPNSNQCVTCHNPSFTFIASDGTCLNCAAQPFKDPIVCNMTREIKQIQKSSWNYDVYSSISMEIILPNRAFFREMFKKIDWNKAIKVLAVDIGEFREPGA
jgi:hypothetical protein